MCHFGSHHRPDQCCARHAAQWSDPRMVTARTEHARGAVTPRAFFGLKPFQAARGVRATVVDSPPGVPAPHETNAPRFQTAWRLSSRPAAVVEPVLLKAAVEFPPTPAAFVNNSVRLNCPSSGNAYTLGRGEQKTERAR
jgi:hypothetical protein